jgi:hypothetical protein
MISGLNPGRMSLSPFSHAISPAAVRLRCILRGVPEYRAEWAMSGTPCSLTLSRRFLLELARVTSESDGPTEFSLVGTWQDEPHGELSLTVEDLILHYQRSAEVLGWLTLGEAPSTLPADLRAIDAASGEPPLGPTAHPHLVMFCRLIARERCQMWVASTRQPSEAMTLEFDLPRIRARPAVTPLLVAVTCAAGVALRLAIFGLSPRPFDGGEAALWIGMVLLAVSACSIASAPYREPERDQALAATRPIQPVGVAEQELQCK